MSPYDYAIIPNTNYVNYSKYANDINDINDINDVNDNISDCNSNYTDSSNSQYKEKDISIPLKLILAASGIVSNILIVTFLL